MLHNFLLTAGVKRRADPSFLQQRAQAGEHLRPQGPGSRQFVLEFVASEFLAVDSPRDAAGFRSRRITPRTEERVKIDSRHTDQRELNRVGAHHARDLRFDGLDPWI